MYYNIHSVDVQVCPLSLYSRYYYSELLLHWADFLL